MTDVARKDDKAMPRFRRSPLAALAWTLVVSMILLGVFAPIIAPYGETEIVGSVWEPPGAEHWLGTDTLGRDIFSRIAYGARTTLMITFAATTVGVAVGSLLGLLAALAGGILDMILSRLIDAMLSIPTLILALVLIASLGTSIVILIGVLALVDCVRIFRIARSLGLSLRTAEFVEACRLRRDPMSYIVARELLPNVLLPLASEYALRLGFTILVLSALSFLGLGVQPPAADWGGMVRDNSEAIGFGLTAPLFPAAFISLFVLGVNLIVDNSLKGRG